MKRRIISLRWRLARTIAPVPIMSDPGEGTYILSRKDAYTVSVRLGQGRLRMTNRFGTLDTTPDQWKAYQPTSRSLIRFVGVVE